MLKEILFAVCLVIVFGVIGVVFFVLKSGTGSVQCTIDPDCGDANLACKSCNGVASCQTRCAPGQSWDSSQCKCVAAQTIKWKCTTSGGLPQCVQSDDCDPATDLSCHSGLDNCSSGCYVGSSTADAVWYLYNPDTLKADMIVYGYNQYTDLSGTPYGDKGETHSSMVLCDGKSPPDIPSSDGLMRESGDADRGVASSFQRVRETVNPRLGDSVETACKDLCTTTTQTPTTTRLGDGTNKYYFKSYSTRDVYADFGADGNGDDRIKVEFDGTKLCQYDKPCFGGPKTAKHYKISTIKIDNVQYYFADPTTTTILTKPKTGTVSLYHGNFWVFIDVPCVDVSGYVGGTTG